MGGILALEPFEKIIAEGCEVHKNCSEISYDILIISLSRHQVVSSIYYTANDNLIKVGKMGKTKDQIVMARRSDEIVSKIAALEGRLI